MKSTNDNPTPTTLRDLIEEMWEYGFNSNGDFPTEHKSKYTYVDQATQSIQEQLKALLPEKMYTPLNMPEIPEPDASVIRAEIEYFNRAIDQIQKAIEEWAK